MNRRLMMAQQSVAENWDFSWDCKQGLLSEYLTLSKTNDSLTETLTEKGMLISAIGSSNMQYALLPKTSNAMIFEIKLEIKSFCLGTRAGMRIALSNGSKGCQIFINQSLIRYESGSSVNAVNPAFVAEKTIQANTEYLIRIEYDVNKGTKVTVNNELLYEGEKHSAFWNTSNRILQQDSGSTYLKEVRFKHIA